MNINKKPNISVKTIYILACLAVVLGMMCQPYLWSISAPGPDADSGQANPKQYENYLLIKYLLHLNQFKEAETLINRHLEDYPQDPFILTEKAFLLSEIQGKYDEALELLKKSQGIYPQYYYTNYLYAFILFTLTDLDPEMSELLPRETAARNKEKMEEAIKCLETAIQDNPEFHDAYYLLGVIFNARGEYGESNRYLKQANRYKQTAASCLYMASNYRHLNDLDAAVKAYEEILSFNPSNYRALRALYEIHLERKEYKTASLYLEKLFHQYPNNQKIALEYLYALIAAGETKKFMELENNIDISNTPILLYAKSLLLTQQGKYKEAEEILKTVKTKDLSTHLLMAEIHLHQHNYYQAYQNLRDIKVHERDHLYYTVKLNALSLLNMNQQILTIFELLRENTLVLEKLTADDFYIFLFACANLDQLEKLREVVEIAKKHLKEKSELFTDLVNALQDSALENKIHKAIPRFDLNAVLLETFYRNKQQYKQAAAILKQLIQNNSDNENAYLELCDIYLEQKQFKKVEHLLKKLSKQYPSSLIVKNFYAYYLAVQNKKLSHALELSAYTLSKNGENPAYIDTYGYILFRMGRLSEAGKYLEKAYQKHPFEQEIMDHLVDYYRAQKENRQYIERIREIYKKAIEHNVDFKDQLIKKIETLENEQKNLP